MSDCDIDLKENNVEEACQMPDLSLDAIAEKLLRDKLHLSALELHTELAESGRELPRLRDFFSNPGNFEKQATSETSPVLPRTSSVQTFDSLDFTRYSDDGDRQADERVAVLEFELRKAKETIKALRANLTVVTESDPNTPESGSEQMVTDDLVKPHEKRALNFLVNEYLLKHNYKLTAITFSDENEDQDFEEWDDVGLNIPQPPELLRLYRTYCRHSYRQQEACDACCQTDTKESEDDVFPQLSRSDLEPGLTCQEQQVGVLRKENEILDVQTKVHNRDPEINQRSTNSFAPFQCVNNNRSWVFTPVESSLLEDVNDCGTIWAKEENVVHRKS